MKGLSKILIPSDKENVIIDRKVDKFVANDRNSVCRLHGNGFTVMEQDSL